MKIIVTGGAGFIGSALIRYIINHTNNQALTFKFHYNHLTNYNMFFEEIIAGNALF